MRFHRTRQGHWSQRERSVGLAMLAVIALAAGGCSGPAVGVVDRIRAAKSPAIQAVVLEPANGWIGVPDEIYIYFVPTATDAQVVDVWCSVAIPAGIELVQDDTVHLARAGVVEPGDVVTGSSGVIKPTCGQGTASPG